MINKTLLASAAILVFAVLSGANPIPPPQIPLHAPPVRGSLSGTTQANNAQAVLHRIAVSLNQGVPEEWERLMQSPNTTGTSAMQTIPPSDLRDTIKSWGLDEDMVDQAHHDIDRLIRHAAKNGIYISQGFSYNWPHCQHSPQTSCLYTLVVVARVPYVVGDLIWRAELAHMFITTVAETLEQQTVTQKCYWCWFRTCCDDISEPRNMTFQELLDVHSVMLTSQSKWALAHLPLQEDSNARLVGPGPSSVDSSIIERFDTLVGAVVGNAAENRDVHKPHKIGLLEEIRNATLSRRLASNSIQLTKNEEGTIPLLVELLSNCFQKAGIEESVEAWWRRAYVSDRVGPISLECQHVDQRIEPVTPSSAECDTSIKVTINTTYSWLLVVPHDEQLDILFIESKLGLVREECEAAHGQEDHPMSGSMIRWGYVDSVGTFHSVQYLAEWDAYPSYVSKVFMDILRFASAHAYLRIPPPQHCESTTLPPPQQYDIQPQQKTVAKALSVPFLAIIEAILLFAEHWDSIVKAIGSNITTTIKTRVCLGFESLDYNVRSSSFQGVDVKSIPAFVEEIVDEESLPDRDDVKRLMTGLKYSTNFTWSAESITYTNPQGQQSYMFFAKYVDAATGLADIVYSTVKSTFVIEPDMLIVRRQKTGCLGFCRSDETSIEHVPHSLSVNDTQILEMFWQMIAVSKLAVALGSTPPKYPDLSGLCSESSSYT